MFKNKKLLKEKSNTLSEHYRKEVMSEKTLEFLPEEEFSNLIDVAKYAQFGIWTAIEAAFCLGYSAGQQELKDRINKHFMKGDAE